MPYQFTISPDLSTRYISGWYVFNTWLQRTLAQHIHLELYRDFDQCRRAIETDGVDLIFANPYDASLLVRDKGFLPVAHPRARPDEVIIAVQTDSPVRVIEDFRPGLRIATSTDPAVQIIGMIMLEAADLAPANP
jgi:phosphonate transport system substrate-binding protein